MRNGSMLQRVWRAGDRGQVVPLALVMLVVLLGMAALAVDVGYWRYQQRLEQSAADSAAIAGASEINYPAAADITSAAKADSASNGFTDGAGSTTVTVNHPPTSGPYLNNTNAVEVFVKKQHPTFFGKIFGLTGQDVRARGVAVLSSIQAPCITVLQGSISGDLTLHGGGQGGINTSPLCGIQVNGNLDVTGQANVDASYVTYNGTGPKGGSYPDGQPAPGIDGSDPCPRLPGCAYLTTLKTTNPGLFSATCLSVTANPLPPGHYCTAITGDRALSAGLFIFDKGPPSGVLTGANVTIYNSCTGSCDFKLDTSDSVVAPLTGATAGMVYFQPTSLVNTITVDGANATIQAMGGVYAPNAAFTFNGQLPTISFFVAGQITMNGGGLNAGTGLTGFPQPTNAVLAE